MWAHMLLRTNIDSVPMDAKCRLQYGTIIYTNQYMQAELYTYLEAGMCDTVTGNRCKFITVGIFIKESTRPMGPWCFQGMCTGCKYYVDREERL